MASAKAQDPSRYVKKLIDENRFYLGIETEELTMPFAIKTVGNKPFLYSSDFPHEVTHESCKHDIGELLESDEITEDDKAAMLWRNAETFYKLPLVGEKIQTVLSRSIEEEPVMETCRAAVITEHNKPLTIERVPIPDLDPGSLLIKITASTLCGTDVHRWHGPLVRRRFAPDHHRS